MAKRSLHIGINDYPGTKSDLSGCVNDANDWESELLKRGFSTKILLDAQATKSTIIKEFTKIINETGPKDIAVITFSGHGTWVPDIDGDEADGRDEALCPYDIRKNGPLLDDDLLSIFQTRGFSARVIFISDSCHSGTVSRAAPSFLDNEEQVPRYMAPEVYIEDPFVLGEARRVQHTPKQCTPETATVQFSGCKDTEYSYDARFNNKPNGAFTYVALKELKKLNPDATYQDWFKAIRKTLPHSRYPQTPQLQASKSQKAWKIFEE